MVTSGAKYVVVFLPDEPNPEALAELAERDFEPEQFRAHGREVYAWCPGGLNKSPVIDALIAGLGRRSTYTVRNWNTVTKLADMAADDG
jgi:uncharacterized protein (DUF1697 family)